MHALYARCGYFFSGGYLGLFLRLIIVFVGFFVLSVGPLRAALGVPAAAPRCLTGGLGFLFRVDVDAGALGVCIASVRYFPGSIFSILQLPIFTRTKRKVG